MTRFNTPTVSTKTVNLAGGEAFKQSPELELVSILLTSFATDQFYRTADDTFERLQKLIQVSNKKFVAKASLYARLKFGMRSITHVLASELAKYISGEDWAKRYYSEIVYRPDDITEIMSYHKTRNGKLSNAMKRGLSLSFAKFNEYELAKYRGEGKGFKLIDAVNILRPKPVETNADALAKLVKNELRSFDTWESELTKAGQNGTDKKDVWIKLIQERKIGYFALLRNLRNIIEQAPEIIDDAIALLKDEKLITKSLVLPFRYATAYSEIAKLSGKEAKKTLVAISEAVDISIKNVPKFEGDTLVVLDTSYSMSGRPAEIGALFSAVLVKSNFSDFMVFSDSAHYQNLNPADSTLTIANSIHFESGGTNFHSIFQTANRKYDRIIILSDMQGWIGYDTPVGEFNLYKKRYDANPFIYSFDLNSYGTMQFPERNVFCLAGFSEKIFDIMATLETDKQALITEIEKIDL